MQVDLYNGRKTVAVVNEKERVSKLTLLRSGLLL